MLIEDYPEWRDWVTRKALLLRPVHRWFAFPHSFSCDLVHALIDEWRLNSDDVILDPFVGAGTTVLAAKERNVAARGYDISPLAELVSRVKISDYQLSLLRSLSDTVHCRLNDFRVPPRSVTDGYPDLVVKALPGNLLRDFARLRITIDHLTCSRREIDFFKVALLRTLPFFSRAKAAGGWLKWTDTGPSPSTLPTAFRNQLDSMLDDVSERLQPSPLSWKVGLADARSLPDPDHTYTAIITSPPYPNRHDYTRIFAVELLFEFLTFDQTKRLRRQSLESHPEARPARPPADDYTPPQKLLEILSRLQQAGVDPRVGRMLTGHFLDIHQCLREMHRVCKAGAKLAFVLGNVQYAGHSVPVDELTAELGERVGLQCTKIRAVRYRGNSAQQMGKYGRRPSREAVVLFGRE